jgi:hypothetical protein
MKTARSSLRGKLRTQRRPGPRNSSPTWATSGPKHCELSICDGRSRAILTAMKTDERPAPKNPSLISPPKPSERGGRCGDRSEERPHGQRSPEGEHAVVEQSCCDALSREPEPVNPRVGAGEPRVPFPDSSAGLGKSRGAASLLGFGIGDSFPFSLSIRFFSTLIRTISY